MSAIDLIGVPFVGVGVLVLLLALGLVRLWRTDLLSTGKKVARTLSSALWAALFIAIEIVLIQFVSTDAIDASGMVFALSSAAIACGGSATLTSKLQLTSKREATNQDRFSSLVSAIARWCVALFAIAAVTLVCFICLERPSNSAFLRLDDLYLNCELAVIAGVVAGCWLIFQRKPFGFALPLIAAFVYGLAEYFVETFKGAAIMPGDLRSASTGMAVAGGYDYMLTTVLLVCLALTAVAIGASSYIRDPLANFLDRKTRPPKETGTLVEEEGQAEEDAALLAEQQQKEDRIAWIVKNVIAFILSLVLGLYIASLPLKEALAIDWEEEGVAFDYWQTQNSIDEFGIIPSFIYALQLEQLEEPPGYTAEKAQALEAALVSLYDQTTGSTPARLEAEGQFDQIKPNVVLVMNESFADLSFLGGLGVGYAGPEYLSHMDAIAKGKTSVSVYGGGTCNSEFESLTGTSLGYVSGGINPYAIYDLSHIDSIPKQFRSLGYTTTAIHPEHPTNWGRDQVYPAIGFDQFISQDSFAGAETSRGHVTDKATYEAVLDQLKSSETPQFIFDLTMQGHGGYETGLIDDEDNVGYNFAGIVDPNAGAATDEYLSSVKLSDQDLQYLITELEQFDEPTVLVFFGDHQPGFSWWFKDRFADDSSETAFQESMYQTDYFIWSNYEIAGSEWSPINGRPQQAAQNAETLDYPRIESNTVIYSGTMAPASLMGWALSFIGAPLSDYQKADLASRRWVQSNNLYGFMDADGLWQPESEVMTVGSEADVYTQGLAIIKEALGATSEDAAQMESEIEAPETAEREEMNGEEVASYQGAIIDNVMRWIAHLNFSEKIR